eukprot:SAG31_NODE_47973_length_203_cov_16.750000_1_plen_22_part_01
MQEGAAEVRTCRNDGCHVAVWS